ncbi:hypothetical protein ACROYT_G039903 [Oculina patagonica]
MHLPSIVTPTRKAQRNSEELKTDIERMLKLKIIQPSHSEWGSSCILVRKPPEKGKLQPPRFVVDYRRLNSVTQGDGYPIPSISSVLDAVTQGKRLVKVGMQLKPSKCTFFAREIEILGHRITQEGRTPISKGVEAVLSIPTPTNTSAVKRFLGLCGYFRDFIPCMSTRPQALRSLLKKGVSFQWTEETARKFQDLTQAITGPDVMLFHPHWNAQFELHVDGSKLGCGAMLAQERDGALRPVRFASRVFTPAESRWTTMHQEFFAVK